MVAGCTCNASWLTIGQARPGGLVCTWCGRAWTRRGQQYVLNAENARDASGLLNAGGEVVLVPRLDGKVVLIGPGEVVAPPGRAGLEQCPDCERGVYRAARCGECDGTGWQVWKACPRCGDTAMWRYLDDRTRMHCQACQASWGLDYPGWLAQRLPERLLAARQTA